jgi:hypothetical protein
MITDQISIRITKSDFRLYCEAPRHLWAKRHGMIVQHLSEFDRHLIDDGYTVESYAQEYLSKTIIPQNPGSQMEWQQTYCDKPYEIRIDALVYKVSTDSYDLYEIKSSTGVNKDIKNDITFQALILEKLFKVDHYYVLHLNKEYNRIGALDFSSLFISEDITEKVDPLKPEVELLREDAMRIVQLTNYEEAEICLSPKDCPCPEICHPGLPDFSIYDIPRLTSIKKRQLLEDGILFAKDIPLSFDLNDKQRLVADCARTNTEHIDKLSLQIELERLQYPLWFLDYETCISAIPLYDGYHPQQQIVFQYSLHRLDQPSGDLRHFCHIAVTTGDPSLELLTHLSADLGSSGTVIVWNKAFEMTRNSEMAKLHPEYAGFLEDVNTRIYDLGDIVNLGFYLHPGFKGSWSIKHVLPVMVPELTYEGLAISKGDQASMAWWNMTFGNLEEPAKIILINDLEEYCKLDTLAMVEVYKKLRILLSASSMRRS